MGGPPGAPGGYGPPPGMDQGMGAPPGGAYAPPGGAMMAPGGFGGPMAGPGGPGGPMGMPGGGGPMGPTGPRGQERNPVMVLVLGMLCCIYGFIQAWSMLNELKEFTRDEDFKPFFMLIPFLNYYFLWIKVPEQVRKAKQMAGSRNPEPQSIVLYIFLFPFALAKDLNEVWNPNAMQ